MTAQGKITLPKAVRDELELEQGDVIEIEVQKA
jgi:AbrB family looped-hinge helix DNA binding protein